MSAPPVYTEHAAQVVPPGRILRYSFRERLVHWLAGLSYVYCLLTGLAFWSPWLFWLAIALGGGQISRILHPWIGLLFIAGVLQMYGLWARQMGITDEDRAWFGSMRYYIRNEDEKMPPVGRYNAGQNSFSGASSCAASCCSSAAWSYGSPNISRGVCAGSATSPL